MANNKEWVPGGSTATKQKTKAEEADQGDPGAAQKALEAAENLMEEVEGYANYFEQLTEEVGGSHQGSSDAIEHMLNHFQQAQEQGMRFVPPFRWEPLDSDIEQHRKALLKGYDQYCTFCGYVRKPDEGSE